MYSPNQGKPIPRTRAKERPSLRAVAPHYFIMASVVATVLLAAIAAHADGWVTVNPDGSVTRGQTEVRASSQVQNFQTDAGDQRVTIANGATAGNYAANDYGNNNYATGNYGTGNTTFFSGTYYPLPTYAYSYPTPGYTYPVGPVFPGHVSPSITTLPSRQTVYGYGHPHNPYYGGPVYTGPRLPPYGQYPSYNYPPYATSGTYYNGPAGGGGTITSSTTTSNNGVGVQLGNGGIRVNIGGGQRSTNSTTTVTTYGGR